jgi:hypothetical protein
MAILCKGAVFGVQIPVVRIRLITVEGSKAGDYWVGHFVATANGEQLANLSVKIPFQLNAPFAALYTAMMADIAANKHPRFSDPTDDGVA